jgi:eukaryotic translation initiation factor 2C
MSVQPAHRQLMVNINVAITAVYAPGNLAVAMMQFRNSSFGARMEAFFRGTIRVQATHLGRRMIVRRVAGYTAKTLEIDTSDFG